MTILMKKTAKIGWIPLTAFLVLAAGCGSGGGDLAAGITPDAPSVVSSTPANQATGVSVTTDIEFTFSEPMDGSSIQLSLNPVTLGAGVLDTTGTVYRWRSLSPLTPGTQYTVGLTGKDLDGNTLLPFSTVFTTDPPPSVNSTGTVPRLDNTTTDVNPDGVVVSVAFTKPIDNTTVNDNTIALLEGGTKVASDVAWLGFTEVSSAQARLTPKNPAAIKDNTAYTVSVSQGVRDIEGIPLVSDTLWKFRTGIRPIPPPDPAVESFLPDPFDTNVSARTTVIVDFNQSMDPSTLTNESIVLSNGVDNVPGDLTRFDRKVIFTPAEVLDPNGRTYTLLVDNSVRSLLGVPLAGDTNTQFSTNFAVTTNLPTGIAAGGGHLLVIISGAQLAAWGNNTYGQVGTGVPPNPVNLRSVVPLLGVTEFAAGRNHSLAVLTDNSVWAWGNNTYGQLGIAGVLATVVPTPTRVPIGVPVDVVAGGSFHSLALQDTGAVWGWGNNTYGQVGKGTEATQPLPVQLSEGENPLGNIVPLPPFRAIAAGRFHSVAVDNVGKVWAWGNNDYGQFGDNTTLGSRRPRLVPSPAANVNFTDVAAGDFHTLFLSGSGTLYSAGRNDVGQLGSGSSQGSKVMVSVLNGVLSITAGPEHSAASLATGAAVAWGKNQSGELGDGTTTGHPSPTPVKDFTGTGEMTAVSGVSAGESFTMFLRTDGTVWVSGDSTFGQLGIGPNVERTLLPVRVFGF